MSYSAISSHRFMALDGYRNSLYADAMRQVITPDSVVLDLGAGMGIHGLVAAAAGARRVYLVEPQSVVQIAREVAKVNRLDDRVVILQGTIEETELPEPVDLIVSVFTGNLLYSEDLLPSLIHARDRYLKPGGLLIPDLAELVLAPVSAPEMHAKNISCWSDPHLGLDFSSAHRFAANEILLLTRDELKAEKLAPGSVVTAMDMTTAQHADCLGKAECRIEKSALCHGLLGWIRIKLGERWLSTDPSEPRVHWSPVMLPLDPPLPLEAGETVKISLKRPAHGDWTWSITAQSGTRRHSSFMSRADGPKRLRKLAPSYRPGLSEKGVGVLRVLEMMRDGMSNQEIALAMAGLPPSSPPSIPKGERIRPTNTNTGEALRQVQGLALRYATDK